MVKTLAQIKTQLGDWFPVWTRMLMYFIPVFILPFSDKIVPILMEDKWPSLPKCVGCAILGTGAGILAVRAYTDRSYGRHADKLEEERKIRNGGDTTRFFPPVTPPAKP